VTTLFNRSGVERKPNSTHEGKPTYQYQKKCHRCGGVGGSEAWRYTGYNCYECGGSGNGGIGAEKLYTAEENARLDAIAAKKQEKATAKRNAELAKLEAERAARRDAFKAANAEILAKVLELNRASREDDMFWSNLYNEWIHTANDLSERQVAMVNERHEQLLARQAAEARQQSAGYIGEVGKRVKGAKVRVVKVIELGMTQFWPQQMRYLVKLETEAGHALTWFTTTRESEHDDFVECAFTVKQHDTYQGKPQTIVQRVAFKQPVEA